MALVEKEFFLVFFAFMVIFLTFSIRKACVRPRLDLLDGSVGAKYFPSLPFIRGCDVFHKDCGG